MPPHNDSEDTPWRDPDTLRRLYHDEYMSMAAVGDELGCSDKTVEYWLHEHDIPVRPKGEKTLHPELKDEAWLREQYVDKELSSDDIADKIGSAQKAVLDALHRYGIETRQPGVQPSWPELYDEEWLREQSKEKPIGRIAADIGCSHTNVWRALRRYGIETRERGSPSGEDNPLWQEPVIVTCSNCDADIERKEWELEGTENHFCDRDCFAEWQGDGNLAGENNPLWNGGKVYYYGPNWHPQRRAALDRDGHECRICGMGPDEHQEAFGEDLHVHHITRLGWYKERYDAPEWYERGNALDNLVTLCEDHHDEWEGVPLAPESATVD